MGCTLIMPMRSMSRHASSMALLGLLLVWGAFGCSPAHPEDLLRDYIEAVRDRDADEVYHLLDVAMRRGMSEEEFRAYFEENYPEILDQADTMEAQLTRQALRVTATLPTHRGDQTITLAQREDAWYFNAAVPTSIAAEGPEATLQALVRALEARDLNALLTLMTRERREVIEAEVDIVIASLRQLLSEPDLSTRMVVADDIATVRLPWGLRLTLHLDRGAWRLHDLQVTPP